jgi:uncharacterized protein (TIGR03083 family)
MPDGPTPSQLAAAAHARSKEVVAALHATPPAILESPSSLPEWTRLTIACHLRYVARAVHRVTVETLAGRAAAFYPEGRADQRPGTLVPEPGEVPADVVTSLGTESERLDDAWAGLTADEWSRTVIEPADNPDLGPVALDYLAMSWLTEVEVHGTDLGLGLADWSDVLVAAALPARLAGLATRRANHRAVDPTVQGSWLLLATDGPCVRLSVDGDRVTSEEADRSSTVDAVIKGTSRDLLAMLLGRPTLVPLALRGDLALAGAFSRAFPGP